MIQYTGIWLTDPPCVSNVFHEFINFDHLFHLSIHLPSKKKKDLFFHPGLAWMAFDTLDHDTPSSHSFIYLYDYKMQIIQKGVLCTDLMFCVVGQEYICVSIYMCYLHRFICMQMHIHVCIHVHMYTHKCVHQRLILGIIP